MKDYFIPFDTDDLQKKLDKHGNIGKVLPQENDTAYVKLSGADIYIFVGRRSKNHYVLQVNREHPMPEPVRTIELVADSCKKIYNKRIAKSGEQITIDGYLKGVANG